MCNCGKSRTASRSGQTWTVTYPAGHAVGSETKSTEVAAKLAAARVPGATYAPTAAS
jgi:hypothetical protein